MRDNETRLVITNLQGELRKRNAATVGRFVYFAIGLSFFIAFFVPQTVLTDVPLLSLFSNCVASVIPTIDKISKASIIPEVTKFYLAISWTLFPAVVLYFIAHPFLDDEKFKTVKYKYSGGILFGIASLFGPYLFAVCIAPQPNAEITVHLGLFLSGMTNRFGLAISGPILMAGIPLAFALGVQWFYCIPRSYFGWNNRN